MNPLVLFIVMGVAVCGQEGFHIVIIFGKIHNATRWIAKSKGEQTTGQLGSERRLEWSSRTNLSEGGELTDNHGLFNKSAKRSQWEKHAQPHRRNWRATK